MKKLFTMAFALTVVTGLGSLASAQDNTPRVDRREQRQQNRIADGLKDGSISSREAARIERREARVERDEARAKADGVVTRQERARLNRELDRTSREIHHDKHNARRR